MSDTLMLRFIAVLVGGACLAGCAAAPVQEMSDARQAIVAARAAGATEANSPEMYAASKAITRAEQHLQAEEYARARLEAMQAKRHAGAALDGVQQGVGAIAPASPGTATTVAKPPSRSEPP